MINLDDKLFKSSNSKALETMKKCHYDNLEFCINNLLKELAPQNNLNIAHQYVDAVGCLNSGSFMTITSLFVIVIALLF
jgi:hypothetical protein